MIYTESILKPLAPVIEQMIKAFELMSAIKNKS